MNLDCHKIKILKKDASKWRIKFLEFNIVMMIENSIVITKINNGFYKVI